MTRRTIALRVPADILAQLMRLGATMRIVGARTETTDGEPMLLLAIDAPDAPKDAIEMSPRYGHDGRPDPVHMVAVDWTLRDGSHTVQALTPERASAVPARPPTDDEIRDYLQREETRGADFWRKQ
jgi:hypothetical protein